MTGERVSGESSASKPNRECRLMALRSTELGVEWPRVGLGILMSGLDKEGLDFCALFAGVPCSLAPPRGTSTFSVLLGVNLAELFGFFSLLARFSLLLDS